MLILTRATVRARRLLAFRRAVPPVDAELSRSPGLLASVGVGETPVVRQGTASLWRTLEDARAFAYAAPGHLDAIRRRRDERWYAEELFARFSVLDHTGTWGGRDPLQDLRVESSVRLAPRQLGEPRGPNGLRVVAAAQGLAGAVVARRLARGRTRAAPLAPAADAPAGAVSVLDPRPRRGGAPRAAARRAGALRRRGAGGARRRRRVARRHGRRRTPRRRARPAGTTAGRCAAGRRLGRQAVGAPAGARAGARALGARAGRRRAARPGARRGAGRAGGRRRASTRSPARRGSSSTPQASGCSTPRCWRRWCTASARRARSSPGASSGTGNACCCGARSWSRRAAGRRWPTG